MIEDLKKIITNNFAHKIDFNFLEWDAVLENTSKASVFHLRINTDYCAEYFKGENISFVIYYDNQAVGVFPLVVYKKIDTWVISGDGLSIIKPLFINNIPKKIKKKLVKNITDIIYIIASELNVNEVNLFESSVKLSTWYLSWLDKSYKSFFTHNLVVDLSLPLKEIKLNFRKSYRPLVNKALKEFSISVYENNFNEVFKEFRLLHLSVSGKKTRSLKSWQIQQKLAENGDAFLVTVREEGVVLGVGFFTHTKDVGSYSVGVYKRELFERPISHGLQMRAIEVLKERGCKEYHIGQKVSLLDDSMPTEKEFSISHFKEGFSSFVHIQPHLRVKLMNK
jgi:FemAB family protein